MLRSGISFWRVSSGSAAVLGLCDLTMDAAPTTAYLMLGERCSRECAFCAQARDSQADEAALSRVLWPRFAAAQVTEAIAAAYGDGRIARACFQVTVHPGYVERALAAVESLSGQSGVPICVSVAARTQDEVAALLSAGAERVTLALDAATSEIYAQAKGNDWSSAWSLLERCAGLYPGHVGTHLIAGLGESERDLIERMQLLADLGVSIGLFALTPVKGTAWANRLPPPLQSYRRVQAARRLIVGGLVRAERFDYAQDGRLVAFGLPEGALRDLLDDGSAFRTAGCPGCNRPYYNERPGGILYNYPHPLESGEVQAELDALLGTLP